MRCRKVPGLRPSRHRSALAAFDHPVRLSQDALDVFALDGIEVARPGSRPICPRRSRFELQLSIRHGPRQEVIGQILHVDMEHRRATEDQGALNDILQLPDVARPGVPGQAQGRIRIHGVDAPAEARGVLLHEEMDQQRYVFAALAQRRQPYRKHIEPVEQISAKFPLVDALVQVAVGCGDYPHIGSDDLVAPHPFESPAPVARAAA